MNPKQLGAAVEKVLEQALAKGGDAFAPVFRSLLVRLQQALASLDTDVFGNIAQTPDNYQKVFSFVNEIVARTFSPDTLKNVVSVFAEAMQKTAELSNVYFSATSKAFNAADPILIAGRAAAVSQAAAAAAPPAADLSSFLSRLLADSISQGSSYEQIAQSLAERLTGADSPMQRYVKTIAKDSVMQFNRTYDQQIAQYYRMVFYLYEGGLQKTSRPFCKEKEGHYYHEREIRSWARENWEGKNPATTPDNIFTLAGGFNCNHKFIPVDNSIVPPAAVERAVRLKWLTEAEYNLYFKKNK